MRKLLQPLRVFAREALIGLYRARAMNLLTVGIIAASLSVREATIKAHRSEIMHKMQAASLPDLVRMSEKIRVRDPGA